MKTKITTLIIMMLLSVTSYSQTSNDIYFIAETGSTESSMSISRSDRPLRPIYIYPPIHISIRNESKGYYITFSHYNYNVTELKKRRPIQPDDKMEIIEKPISFLETINPIDLNELEYSWQEPEEAWDFGNSVHSARLAREGKKIYFIDRADITESTVKLIEIKYTLSNKPQSEIVYRDTIISK